MQLDTAERGFSFSRDGPLDMRMGPSAKLSAADIVNAQPEAELGRIFREFGEERHWRRFARNICDARATQTLQSTAQLLKAMRVPSTPTYIKGRKQIHPATRVFQALRIAVNEELAVLEAVLPQAIECLAPGGRLAVISFHSLEDRIVKRAFLTAAGRNFAQGNQQDSWDLRNHYMQEEPALPEAPTVQLLTKKPLQAAAEEAGFNPRSRSAKLRAVQKL
ncbi:hypothetical protein WJX73_002820 [Symbiochloris irregularis]|uniref:Ribosomal RNA small subunit methyltransferase H n=1 Tax=Symbiochloris irregularis TaxID=706552 RepID=A0AAW1NPT5_9CHLO